MTDFPEKKHVSSTLPPMKETFADTEKYVMLGGKSGKSSVTQWSTSAE